VLHDHADAADIELVVERPGLDGRPLPGEERVRTPRSGDGREQPDDPELVLGVALVELLAARLADVRVGGHVDAGARPRGAGFPRSLGARTLAVHVELGRVLAEVPDVSVRVLAVPVGRALAKLAGEVEAIQHDRTRDTVDRADLP